MAVELKWKLDLKGTGKPVDVEKVLPLQRETVYGLQVPPQVNGVKIRYGVRGEKKPRVLDFVNSIHIRPLDLDEKPRTQIIFMIDDELNVWMQSAGASASLSAHCLIYPYRSLEEAG